MDSKNTLDEWLSYIETAHTQAIDMSLGRVVEVFNRLSLNYANSCIVTVAGTNGKGTTCRFIEQTCLRAPLSTGVFSSPHINKFNERIRVDGKDVSDALLCSAFSTVYDAAQGIQESTIGTPSKAGSSKYYSLDVISLSYFEYTTLCAFVIFARAELSVWIIEVGLGGRLDASNVIDAHIGVITSIGLDHQSYLGDTLEAIAGEKAGIIKPAQKVVIGYDNMQDSVKQTLRRFSSQRLVCDKDFGMRLTSQGQKTAVTDTTESSANIGWLNIADTSHDFTLDNTKIPAQNVMTALASISFIAEFFANPVPLLLPVSTIQSLIDSVCVPGRFETVNESPCIIVDVAHNEDSAKYLVSRLQQTSFKQYHIIVGMLKDKNIEATINVLSAIEANWYCVDLPEPRGEKAQRLKTAVQKSEQRANTFDSVSLALKQALAQCQSNDVIVVVGSFILAANFMQALAQHKRER